MIESGDATISLAATPKFANGGTRRRQGAAAAGGRGNLVV